MAKELIVTATVPADPKKGTPQLGPVSIKVQNGETAAEMIKMFGDEAVKSNADSAWVITLQSAIRSALKRGETAAQIQERMANAKMGVSIKKAVLDPTQVYLNMFASASPAEQAAMIAELKKRASAKVPN